MAAGTASAPNMARHGSATTIQFKEAVLELTVTPAAATDEDGETVGLFGFLPRPESRPMGADEALYKAKSSGKNRTCVDD